MTTSTGVKWAIGSGLTVSVGALLPWGVFRAPFVGQISISGIEGDGVITLTLGVVIGAVAWFARTKLTAAKGRAIVVLSALVTWVAISDIVGVSSVAQEDDLVLVGAGSGLWVTLLAGVAGIGGGVTLVREAKTTATRPPSSKSE